MTDSELRVHTPVADQTLWSIATGENGCFTGTARTLMWIRTPDGTFQQVGDATNAMDGTITHGGEVTIIFTPARSRSKTPSTKTPPPSGFATSG